MARPSDTRAFSTSAITSSRLRLAQPQPAEPFDALPPPPDAVDDQRADDGPAATPAPDGPVLTPIDVIMQMISIFVADTFAPILACFISPALCNDLFAQFCPAFARPG